MAFTTASHVLRMPLSAVVDLPPSASSVSASLSMIEDMIAPPDGRVNVRDEPGSARVRPEYSGGFCGRACRPFSTGPLRTCPKRACKGDWYLKRDASRLGTLSRFGPIAWIVDAYKRPKSCSTAAPGCVLRFPSRGRLGYTWNPPLYSGGDPHSLPSSVLSTSQRLVRRGLPLRTCGKRSGLEK
jgi:hypothetical protein